MQRNRKHGPNQILEIYSASTGFVEIFDPCQRKFRDMFTDRLDFLAVIAQLGVQALQHRM